MNLCAECPVAPEGIKGFGFWYCSIECWPKCMSIWGYERYILKLCKVVLLGLMYRVQLCFQV